MKSILILFFTGVALFGCNSSISTDSGSSEQVDYKKGNVYISSPEEGSIYINGKYIGKKTPSIISLQPGEHRIAVGLDTTRQYLQRNIDVTKEPQTVKLSLADKVEPNTWKALFVGVPVASGQSPSGECSTHFSEQDLDDGFDFFQLNLRKHIEPFSYGTVKWDIERRDLTKPVELTYNPKNKWYTLESNEGLAELDNVQPGEYDTVFFFWREEDGSCRFNSSYFGLAWLEPTSDDARKTGYVTVKFNPEQMGVKAKVQQYLDNDPGVWTHEWLHIVIEKFYPNQNVKTPIPPVDKLILHSAGTYGYEYPWLGWYKDLISGQVPLGKDFVGIGPEALMNCSVRQYALNQCSTPSKE